MRCDLSLTALEDLELFYERIAMAAIGATCDKAGVPVSWPTFINAQFHTWDTSPVEVKPYTVIALLMRTTLVLGQRSISAGFDCALIDPDAILNASPAQSMRIAPLNIVVSRSVLDEAIGLSRATMHYSTMWPVLVQMPGYDAMCVRVQLPPHIHEDGEHDPHTSLMI
jgi:hypothetical protein